MQPIADKLDDGCHTQAAHHELLFEVLVLNATHTNVTRLYFYSKGHDVVISILDDNTGS
jgi:hypothetical protein